MLDKQFFSLDEIQGLGLPAARTLRNRLDARTGLIAIGGDAPPLQTLLLGGSRVISRVELERWLGSFAQAPAPAAPSEQRRRRGRPRKSSLSGGGAA